MAIAESELIFNNDGSIYHLNLKPGQLAPTIITVGDQDRVDLIATYLDKVELSVQKREFKTITGLYKNRPISIISTGIGTDNIDIVFNEIDALFNIDFQTREIKDELTKLTFVRIGTSGVIHPELDLDQILISAAAIGTDGLMNFYDISNRSGIKRLNLELENIHPYLVHADQDLIQHFSGSDIIKGITVTANGFYGPQMREVRLKPIDSHWLDQLKKYTVDDLEVTNLEMETAGIYCMAKLLGHRAISINALLANRSKGHFSKDAKEMEKKTIEWSLAKISELF